jgi:hypothetical protein
MHNSSDSLYSMDHDMMASSAGHSGLGAASKMHMFMPIYFADDCYFVF